MFFKKSVLTGGNFSFVTHVTEEKGKVIISGKIDCGLIYSPQARQGRRTGSNILTPGKARPADRVRKPSNNATGSMAPASLHSSLSLKKAREKILINYLKHSLNSLFCTS